ncbi:hypothetical protein L208DRAFT_1288055, partial [Tricholoma matsutake]
MASPPGTPSRHELQGASRITGGILRGHAQGNVYNIADRIEYEGDISPTTGKVFVFWSHGNPDTSEPYMTLSHHVTPTLGPVLKKLGIQYSPVSKKNQQIFVYEDDFWAVKGRYNTAV